MLKVYNLIGMTKLKENSFWHSFLPKMKEALTIRGSDEI